MIKVSLLPRLALKVSVTAGRRSNEYLLHPECVTNVPVVVLAQILQGGFYSLNNAEIHAVHALDHGDVKCYRCRHLLSFAPVVSNVDIALDGILAGDFKLAMFQHTNGKEFHYFHPECMGADLHNALMDDGAVISSHSLAGVSEVQCEECKELLNKPATRRGKVTWLQSQGVK